MAISPESIALAGSGLVFVNYYGDGVTDPYRNAVITAEHQLQGLITNAMTVTASFDLQALGAQIAAQNTFTRMWVSYDAFASLLRAHATTGDDFLAVNGLPSVDPTGGAGFAIPTYMAEGLGLRPQTSSPNDLKVTLNSSLPWTYGQDAVGAILHELTEGAFGRFSSLGRGGDPYWSPLDLFRFTAGGQRDYTGGADGQTTYFGLDSFHVSSLAFHNSISPGGMSDGQDLGDWAYTLGDAFGPGGPGAPGAISTVDQQVMDVLGWTSAPFATTQTAPRATAGDDLINGNAGGDSIDGLAGADTIVGSTGQNTLYGGDGADSITGGPDLNIVNGNQGDDTIIGRSVVGDRLFGGQGADLIDMRGSTGHNLVNGNIGSDTVYGGSGGDSLRGGQGDDLIVGGAGDDWISGDRGTNTLTGGHGADTFHAGAVGGTDYVTDFDGAEGDRIQLDWGVSYYLFDESDGLHIVYDNGLGGQMILQGVHQQDFQGAWILQ
jgi:Ca2+-binding RTX toxin-like protein